MDRGRRAWTLAWALTALGCTAPNPAFMPETTDARPRVTRDAALTKADGAAPLTPDGAAPSTPDSAMLPRPDSATTPDSAAPIEVAASVDPRLLGYWPLDEGAGATVARDLSGHKRDGTLDGQAQGLAFVPGHIDGALSFPGGSSAAVGVRVPYSTEIDELRAFTLVAWFRLASVPPSGVQRSVISRQLGTGSGEVFNLTANNGDIVVYIPGTGGQVNFEARAKGAAVLNAWTHAAATYDGRYLRLYINGTQAAVSDFPNRLVSSPSTPVYIGTNKNATTSEPFHGLIDEVALYSYALPASEIARLAKGASPLDVR